MSFPHVILTATDRTDRIASAIGRLFLLFQTRNSLDNVFFFFLVVETKTDLKNGGLFVRCFVFQSML